MANAMLSNSPVKYNDPSTSTHSQESKTFTPPRSFRLESMRYMPKLNDALCMVRDIATGAKRQIFASRLYLYEFGNCGSFMVAYEKSATREGQ